MECDNSALWHAISTTDACVSPGPQVLVMPYRQSGDGWRYALFRRADAAYWQGVAGGGEAGESALQAARREAAEEAGLDGDSEFVALDACAMIPVVQVTGELTWGPDVLVIPEYAFGARAEHAELTLSREHTRVILGPPRPFYPIRQ